MSRKSRGREITGPRIYKPTYVPDVPQEREPSREEIRPTTSMTLWSRHLDGVDEHRCNACHIAFPNREPLCEAGQALYDASH